MRRWYTWVFLLLILPRPILVASADPSRKATNGSPGIVVEDVTKNSTAEEAGIRQGDRLIAWRRPGNQTTDSKGADGTFREASDFLYLNWEQSPRGKITLTGLRNGKPVTFVLPPDNWEISRRPWMPEGSFTLLSPDWGMSVMPLMPAATLSAYEQARAHLKAGEPQDAFSIWMRTASEVESANPHLARWFWTRAADALSSAQAWQLADEALDRAARQAEREGDAQGLGEICYRQGSSRYRRQDMAGAEISFKKAAELWRGTAGDSLTLAAVTATLALVANLRGDSATNDALEIRALELRKLLAPQSPPVAASLDVLGRNAATRGDFESAEAFHLQALEIGRRFQPGGLSVAMTLNYLGNVARRRGDLVAAQQLHSEALNIRRRANPDSPQVASSLHNLGNVAIDRGDLAAAEDFHREALDIRRRKIPGSAGYAASLESLADISRLRGDLVGAEVMLKEMLTIERRFGNDGTDFASGLSLLGQITADRGDPTEAKRYYQQALEIQRTHDHYEAVRTLTALADVDLKSNSAEAEAHFAEALELAERIGAVGAPNAGPLNGLAGLALKRLDVSAAELLYQRALDNTDRFAPGTFQQAQALRGLAKVALLRKDFQAALMYFHRAVDAIEKQGARVGGPEELQAALMAKYADYYHECIAANLLYGKAVDAFAVLERSRARSLLSMLAQRDLVFNADLPAGLERERKLTDAAYDRAENELQMPPANADARAVGEIRARLGALRAKQAEIAQAIAKASPRYGALQYPKPLDVSGAQAALDPGTLLLSYSVGKEKSFLFVVSPDPKHGPPLSVFAISIGEKDLRESVDAFRRLIEWNKPSPEATARSRSLYDTLLKPAEPLIAKADRLLILPEGSLHTLPWAALLRDSKAGQTQYLAEWKPFHTAVSATVYSELKKSRREKLQAPTFEVAAFGDPKYPSLAQPTLVARRGDGRGDGTEETAEVPEDLDQDSNVRAVVRGGYRLEPLPRSREEVQSIASLYAPKSEVFLAEEATEERAKSLGKDIPIIHFACHAILNERFPLDSALALSIPEHPKEGQDNGLLQAWEIFEKVRIDADLVTLSACDSGLGKEMGGEGLIGLTRAFQYAGARSILASLWKVEDTSTAELMKRFYQYLKGGKTKDEALRLSQIDLIHSPNFSSPVHWAAFELIGDWR